MRRWDWVYSENGLCAFYDNVFGHLARGVGTLILELPTVGPLHTRFGFYASGVWFSTTLLASKSIKSPFTGFLMHYLHTFTPGAMGNCP